MRPGVKLRQRARDPELPERRTDLYNAVVGKIAAVSQCSHSKGAYQERDWMDMRATLLGFWAEPEFQQLVTESYGRKLEFPTFEKIFRREMGSLSPAERARDKYIQASRSDKPDYAGEYLQLDGSEIPVHILNGWGRARKSGDVAQVMAALTDVASLRTWLYTEGTTSEVSLWSPLLLKYFREVGSAPKKILTDLGGRLFHQLWNCSAGQPIPLDLGLRVALASGVQPQNHSAHNARAKGAVESGGIKSSKSTAKRLLVSRLAAALFRELPRVPLDSHGHVAYRQIGSQAEWQQFVIQWETLLNSRLVHRVGDGSLTRQLIWDLAEYVARRAECALAADWQDRYLDITRSGYCMEVRGEENRLFYKGARAELIGKLAEPCREGSIAVLFPGGMRAGDEQRGKEFLRGVIIEGKPQGGLLTYHAVEANKVSKTFLGWEADAPKVGEPPKAIPETEHERNKRLFAAAGRNEVAKIRAAKATVAEGTSGEALRVYE